MELAPGQLVLDRYRIESVLGRGGMGIVYRARHVRLDRPVAVKVLTAIQSPKDVERFEQEAQLLARMRHPNVVSILDVGTVDHLPAIAMELVEGETLAARLKRHGPVPWPLAVEIGIDIARGLAAIHAEGILHRDLKTGNIVVCPGEPRVVKLIDFGIARPRLDDRSLTQTGRVIGTPETMAPEQLLGGELDERCDLYAAGLVLYLLLAGRLPFGTSRSGLLERLRTPAPVPQPPPERPPLPPGLGALVVELLALQPKERPASAAELATRLGEILRGARERTVAGPMPVDPAPAPAPAAPPVVPASGTGPAAAPSAGRFLVAARLPSSRLAQRDERRWLASLAAPRGRGYTLGGGIWFAVQGVPSAATAETAAGEILASLTARYGDTATVAWSPVGEGFELTAAGLTGATPLPGELTALIERL